MGLYDITTETTAATINSFLQHYNMPTSLGVTLQACLENLQIELGVPDNPLMYDFTIWGALATDSWIKALWEKIHAFQVEINMDYKKIQRPRDDDICLMHRLVADGIRGE